MHLIIINIDFIRHYVYNIDYKKEVAMDYISVKDAAEKFKISERRIQKLCETNRIDGCTRVSGIWLIPSDAVKPMDERTTSTPDPSEYLSLKEVCEELSISTATGRNWIKLGKLIPENDSTKKTYFTKDYITTLKDELQSGKNSALKSRRNKKFVSGYALYNSYVSENCINIPTLQKLLALISENEIILSENVIQYILADCAIHLLGNKNNFEWNQQGDLLLKFLNQEITAGTYDLFIADLIDNCESAKLFCKQNSLIFNLSYEYEPHEDILGLIYISCKNIYNRKATGSYYTSTKVVKQLISKFEFKENERVLDPCCGTGNFLLQLPDIVPFDNIYGNDIDVISVKITKLNMALKYDADINIIDNHITNFNYLTDFNLDTKYHYVIGNPPWGYDFSKDEKAALRAKFISTSNKNIESYDIFIEQALRNLTLGGHLAFVLPEALLNVKAHTDIRNIILSQCSIRHLDFLGNAFDGVQCPCIIMDLQYQNKPLTTVGMMVSNKDNVFTINTSRTTSSDYFSFIASDEEYELLQKVCNIDSVCYLKGNADFALGIVTGNNKAYISKNKTETNEMILKGADISKYHINPSANYIVFKPENFQQIAPTQMYRAPEKLLYRFISSQLVFAYDNLQTLSLNSCNIVIPKLPELKMKYILAILNSRVAQFIYKKEFNSVKVLRSHIESIPIPVADVPTQDKIISVTNQLIAGLNGNKLYAKYDELDSLVCDLFQLTDYEQRIIKRVVDIDNKFLE